MSSSSLSIVTVMRGSSCSPFPKSAVPCLVTDVYKRQMHIGIPVLNKKPNMVYNEWGGFWVNGSVDAYDYKIEYLKFEEGTRFPEILSKQPHVAYKVDNMDPDVYKRQSSRCGRSPET